MMLGKTTAMLTKAVQAAEAGEKVYVVAHNEKFANELLRRCTKESYIKRSHNTISAPSGGTITFISQHQPDWIRGINRDTHIFTDHYVKLFGWNSERARSNKPRPAAAASHPEPGLGKAASETAPPPAVVDHDSP